MPLPLSALARAAAASSILRGLPPWRLLAAAATSPALVRSIIVSRAELTMLCGFYDDLAKQATATSNRIRGLLTQIHLALERVLGPRLDHPAVLDLLRTRPTPEALRHAGRRRIETRLTKLAPRMGKRLGGEIIEALDQQTVTVVGTNAATIVLPQLARMLADIRESRRPSSPRSKPSWRPTLFTRS
ncbi:hypothetical protein ACVWYS_002158 [Arthrobacter sp. TE12231]